MEPKNAAVHGIMRQNELILTLMSQYLNYTPRFLTAELVENLASDCQISKHEAFLALFGAALGLDVADNPEHRKLERLYLRTGVQRAAPEVYQSDAYYRAVKFPCVKSGKWEFKESFYAPYEPFVRRDPVLCNDLREIPQIGYFEEEFRFPAVLENGVEWMTVTPNEVETMKLPIQKSTGDVLTLGLGLGYFAFCASQKEDVGSVTVIERDEEIIALFCEHLLPQFPHGEKIKIIRSDAFDFLQKELPKRHFDYLFADLWHDASDGLELYVRLKRILKHLPRESVDYWIEPSLLSSLRRMVYEKLTDPHSAIALGGVSMEELLSDDFLKKLDPEIN